MRESVTPYGFSVEVMIEGTSVSVAFGDRKVASKNYKSPEDIPSYDYDLLRYADEHILMVLREASRHGTVIKRGVSPRLPAKVVHLTNDYYYEIKAIEGLVHESINRLIHAMDCYRINKGITGYDALPGTFDQISEHVTELMFNDIRLRIFEMMKDGMLAIGVEPAEG